MIIDAHVHVGNKLNFPLDIDDVEKIMKEKGISNAVVSSVEAVEVDHNQFIIKDNVKTQIEVNMQLLDLVKNKPNFSVLAWCKPLTEGWNQEFEHFLIENLDKIKGLKFHPFHSDLKITDKRVKPYLEFANLHRLSVKVHCADDKKSKSKYVYRVAKKYKNINFIMAHLELGGNYQQARKYLLRLPNLYADTAWLPNDEVIKIIEDGGQDKIIFGSDAPIDGENHYKFYSEYFSYDFIRKISLDNYYLLMSNNAKKVYKI